MPRMRVHGEDAPFPKWMREKSGISEKFPNFIYATDVDLMLLRYGRLASPVAKKPAKSVQCSMFVESKSHSRGGSPFRSDDNMIHSQQDSLHIMHQSVRGYREVLSRKAKQKIGHVCFGVFVICHSGEGVSKNSDLWWWQFCDNGDMQRREITYDELVALCSLSIRPDTFEPCETDHDVRRIVTEFKGL